MERKIIITVFPQDKQKKLRPALVLREFPKYGDVLVYGITSKLNQYIPGFDLLLDTHHPDFMRNNLKLPDTCRLNMLKMLTVSDINGSIGEISFAAHSSLLKTLSAYLLQNNYS